MGTLRHVERFTATLTGLSVTATLSTTLLDLSKSFIVWGCQSDSGDPRNAAITGVLTNTTTVTFTRETNNIQSTEIIGYVVEFTSGVSVQRGLISNESGGSGDVILSSIDLSKSWHWVSHLKDGGTWGTDDSIQTYLWDDGGTKKLHWSVAAGVIGTLAVISWEVIEYDDCSVQRDTVSIGANDTSVTDAITAVDRESAFLNFDYQADVDANPSILQTRGQINSTTQLTFDRDTAPGGPGTIIDISWEVVEFTDGTLVQEVLESYVATDGQEDATITEISGLDKSIAFASGMMKEGLSGYTTSDIMGGSWFTADLTSVTNLQTIRGFTTADAAAVFYVVDFEHVGSSSSSSVSSSSVSFSSSSQSSSSGESSSSSSSNPCTYEYIRTLTINKDLVGLNNVGVIGVLGFPVVVELSGDWLKSSSESPSAGHVESNNGYDIIFTEDDGVTPLDHEVQSYNPSAGELIAWVRFNSLSKSTDTDFQIHYGNSSISTATESPSAVWANNFVGVYHLDEKDTGSTIYVDRSPLGNDGDSTSEPTQVAGKIGNAQDFDEPNDEFIIVDDLSQYVTNQMTISGWVKPASSSPADYQGYFGFRNGDADHSFYLLQLLGTDDVEARWRNSTGAEVSMTLAGIVSADTFVYLTLTYNSSNLIAYVNGVYENNNAGATGSFSSSVIPFGMGREGGSGTNFLDGIVDEVRVADTPRSADWIVSEFNNQTDTTITSAGFISYLSEEEFCSSSSSVSSSSSSVSSSSSSVSSSSSSCEPGTITYGNYNEPIDEDFNFTFENNWSTGDGWVITPGLSGTETISTSAGCYTGCTISDPHCLGVMVAVIDIDKYLTGYGPIPFIEYRTDTIPTLSGSWILYNGISFPSLGWVQLRLCYSSSSSSSSTSSSSSSTSSSSSSSSYSSSSSSSSTSSSSSSASNVLFRITEEGDLRTTIAGIKRIIEP